MTQRRARWRATLLDAVRHGRPVAWTPHFMGFGNTLYIVMWAYQQARDGRPTWCLEPPALKQWRPVFPGLDRFVLERSQVRFTDRRELPWRGVATTEMPEPQDMGLVADFLDEVLLPGSSALDPRFLDRDPDRLVVNVRRGDYYSDPEIRAQYGFDVADYLRRAVTGTVLAQGRPTTIHLVSDDLPWCRRELGWLADHAPVTFAASDHSAVEDFLEVAAARRLVITNSTFSYWAAYVGNHLRGDNHASVWAPRFFDRTRNGGRGWLLDERWSVLEELDPELSTPERD